jgi:hypothetical protein
MENFEVMKAFLKYFPHNNITNVLARFNINNNKLLSKVKPFLKEIKEGIKILKTFSLH